MNLVRVSEAATILQVSPQTVRNLVNDGVLTGVKINPNKANSPIRIPLDQIRSYINEPFKNPKEQLPLID